MGFVVVGIDGSETSRVAFDEAVQQAAWRDTSVLALHVVSYPVTMGYDLALGALDSLRDNAAEFLRNEMDQLKQRHGGSFAAPVESRWATGHAGAELIGAASGEDGDAAELVVLGSRGLGGVRGLLLGSVTSYAVHHLSCRLLIVPHVASDDDGPGSS